MSKRSRRILSTTLVLVFGLLVMLRTAIGGSSLLWLAKTLIIPGLGINLDYEKAAFVPMKSIEFQGLHFKWAAPDDQLVDLLIGNLKISYQAQLFPLRIAIDEFEIIAPTISANLKLGSSPEEPKSTFDLKKLLKSIEELKVTIDINRVKITGMKGVAKIQMVNRIVEMDFSEINLTSDFALKKAFLNLNFETDLGKSQGLRIKMNQRTPDNQKVAFSTVAHGFLRLNMTVQKQQNWDFVVRSGGTEINLAQPNITLSSETSQKAIVTDKINFTFGSKIKISPDRFCDAPENQDFRISTVIETSPIQISDSETKQKVQATAHKWSLAVNKSNGGDLLSGSLGVTGLKLKLLGIQQTIPVDTQLGFSITKGCESGALTQALGLSGEDVLNSALTFIKDKDQAQLDGAGKISIPPKLAKTFQESVWKQFGLWKGDWALHLKNSNQQWNGDLKAKLIQNFALGRSARSLIAGPIALNVELKNSDTLAGSLNIEKIVIPKISDPFGASASFKVVAGIDHGKIVSTGEFQLNLDKEAAASGTFGYHPPKWEADIMALSQPILARFMKASEIQQVGNWNIKVVASGELAGGLHVLTDLTRTLAEVPKRVELGGPIRAKLDIAELNQPKNLSIDLQLPETIVGENIKWGGHSISIKMKHANLTSATNVEAHIGKNTLEFLSKDKKSVPINGVEGNLNVTLVDGKVPLVEDLDLRIGDGAIRLNAKSHQDSSGRNSLDGKVIFSFPESWPELPFGKFVGGGAFPWRLSQQPGDIITFDGKISFENFSAAIGAAQILKLAGDIPITQVLHLKKNKMTFANIRQINPFEFVEFENFQPLTKTFLPLTVEQIQFKEKTYGPFKAYVSLDQNFFETRGLSLEIPGGFIVGDLILDLNPDNRTLGFLARASGVRLKSLVPQEFSRGVVWSDEPMSGQAGMVVSINKKEMTGRFDLTQIGSTQLISMINWVDPLYESDKLSACRTGLSIAYPKVVLGKMQNGFLDLSMVLGGLTPMNYDVHSIPIAALVVSTFDRFGLK